MAARLPLVTAWAATAGKSVSDGRRDEDFIYQKRVVRRTVLAWSVVIITVTIMAYLEHIGKVNASDASIIIAIIGILAAVIKYQDEEQ